MLQSPISGIIWNQMVSGVFPRLYAAIQAIVELLPSVPVPILYYYLVCHERLPIPSAETELPLAILDGFTHAYLLCNLIPPAVTTNALPLISSSPWTLLVTSLLVANGGFFMTNLFSFNNPKSLSVQTPLELQAYSWTMADIWCAPTITALYALLTHAQPFWADLHSVLAGILIPRCRITRRTCQASRS
ncbi:hypothetical protein BDZ97DRAFT_426764 [Flammula alnicola]|nr:hypothetical protein BDZ97DRAFT_426764 [Flammula alnicola]